MVTFIDLFAGIGGMRLGMEENGFECVFSSEWDEHAQEMYKLNFGSTPEGDITKINENDVPNHDILLAGFPCQPFSISGKKEGFADTRGTLFFDVLRIANAKKPEVILLENVKHLVHHDGGRTLEVILNSLKEIGYKVSWKVLNAKDFGVAQNRERIIIIATKKTYFDFDLLKKHTPVYLKDVLDKEGEFEYLKPEEYTLLKPEQLKIQKSGLIFAGYRNKKMRENGVRPGTEHLSRVHKQPNRIYSIEGTHPTLPSQETTGRFFIYNGKKVRKLTLRECYRLMGFPETFKLHGTTAMCYLRVGNSVCVNMFMELGRAIKESIFENEGENQMTTQRDILEMYYNLAIENIDNKIEIEDEDFNLLKVISENAEKSKAVFAVLVTSLVQKIYNQKQDIRLHQSKFEEGYSGRSVDTKYITPFLLDVGFPAMKESGWLTRSLEQAVPYNLDYPGSIKNKKLKDAFLSILDNIETYNKPAEQYLQVLLILMLQEQKNRDVEVINPIDKETNVPIRNIMEYLKSHFEMNYGMAGASRLPVLAFYSIYQCLNDELGRFNDKILLPIGNHNSADLRSGAVGDIEVVNAVDKSIYEGVEIKFGIKIDKSMLIYAYDKFKDTQIQRYYILSSAGISDSSKKEIDEFIEKIELEHGCQVIVNGLYPSLKYYLRLIKNTDKFLTYYVENLKSDETIKKEHKLFWNKIFLED